MSQKIGWILASCALACLLLPSVSAAKSYTVTVQEPEACVSDYHDGTCGGLGDASTTSDPVSGATGGVVKDPLTDPLQIVTLCLYKATFYDNGQIATCQYGYVHA